MDILIRAIHLYFIFMLGRFILNLYIGSKKVSKANKNKEEDNQNINNWHERVKKIKKELNMLEMVKDEVCEAYLQREKAYQVVEDDKTHYFCSWECRQKYIEEKKKKNMAV